MQNISGNGYETLVLSDNNVTKLYTFQSVYQQKIDRVHGNTRNVWKSANTHRLTHTLLA